ncbi:MAG: HlyD family type I secretion periplasmic adaptor subunit [Acidovorax sp.]|nr:HlyD family type I secretion periplasmic adaptor subunit [Acidovorax sp.]
MSSVTQALTKRLLPDAAEFSPGLLAIQESPMPKLPRLILYLVGGLFAILLAWAVFAKIDIVAVADGKLVPVSYTKIVQPAEAGVVAEILVAEGDPVQAGQVLIRLDPTMTGADSRSLASELTLKRLTLRRVDAELAGIPLAIKDGDEPVMIAQVQAQANAHRQAFTDALAQEVATRERAQNELRAAQETLTKLKSTLPSYEQSAKAHSKLVAEGFLSPIAGNDKEREAIEKSQDLKAQAATVQGLLSTITAQDKKIAGLSSTFRSQLLIERTEAMGQLAKLEQDTQKMGYKTGLLELKAPQAGIVKDVATTSKGAVVQPGMVLLTLVPRGEQLLAEVQVKNEDVGFVQTGQHVRVKVAAYPFQKYGLLEGRIQTLAPDSQASNNNNPGQSTPQGYKALVKLDTQYLESLNGDASQRKGLEAGMQVAAEIHQGRRTIMEYLLSPVQKVSAEAGRER